MLAAVGQICSRASVPSNLAACASVIRRAAASGAKLVLLPEAADFIAPQPEVSKLSTPLDDSPFVDGIKAAARKGEVWVGVGVHEKGPEERCWNTQLLISPTGEIVQAYRKVHLFDVDIKGGAVIKESKTTIPGDKILPPYDTPLGKIGLLTCYDLRFPEASLSLRRQGAQMITYPSAFTTKTGAAHWEPLLRARAIETQSYVLAAAQTGEHAPGRMSHGHACIVDPWGTIVAQCRDVPQGQGEDEGVYALAEIDLEWLEKLRRDMPLWEQRRTDVYPLL